MSTSRPTQHLPSLESPIKKTTSYFTLFFTLVTAGVIFIANSHPFMYPGYDIWWHLGKIESIAFEETSSHRYAWHIFWHHIFTWLPPSDIFDKALIIHRAQFLLSIGLVVAASYLVLLTIFHRSSIHRHELLLLAGLGGCLWLLMHGTWSTAHYGGTDSQATMAWVSWYSVNYQIALPFYYFATALFLYTLSAASSYPSKISAIVILLACISLIAIIHLAELPYFLMAAGMMWILHTRSWSSVISLLITTLLAAAGTYFAVQTSYRTPELFDLVAHGQWKILLDKILEHGTALINDGRNRANTGWTSFHATGCIVLIISLISATYKRNEVSLRPLAFTLATGIMPMMLLNPWSMGLLATITYPNLAWRFSFASFLFLAIPISLATAGLFYSKKIKPYAQAAILMFLLGGIYAHGYWVDKEKVVNQYAQSLWRSLDPHKVYFGLSTKEKVMLDSIHARLLVTDAPSPICADIFSAYYLFFLKDYDHVFLPGNLKQLPTVKHPQHSCQFPRNNNDLATLGIESPSWRYRIIK